MVETTTGDGAAAANDDGDGDDDNSDGVTIDSSDLNPLQSATQVADLILRCRRRWQEEAQQQQGATGEAERQLQLQRQKQEEQRRRPPPGLMEGLAVAVAMTALMIPVRRQLIRTADRHFGLGRVFPDLVVTSTQAMWVASTTLYAGSLYGSLTYLNEFVKENENHDHDKNNSATARATAASTAAAQRVRTMVCHDDLMQRLLQEELLETTATATAAEAETEPASELSWSTTASSLADSWDPRPQTLQAYYRVLNTCRQQLQHETQQEQASSLSGEEKKTSSRNWWWS